jgi:hypothetical protein
MAAEHGAQQVDQAWVKAANANDVEATVSLYAPDAVAYFPDGEFKGKDAIRKSWTDFYGTFTVKDVKVVPDRGPQEGRRADPDEGPRDRRHQEDRGQVAVRRGPRLAAAASTPPAQVGLDPGGLERGHRRFPERPAAHESSPSPGQ